MKKILLAAVVCCMAVGAWCQQEFEALRNHSFAVAPFWFHPTSDSTVELVPCQEGCTPLGGSVTVPGYVSDGTQTYKVNRLGAKCFGGISAQASDISLPETIEELGFQCFSGSSIRTIVLPGSLRKIERYAFSSCALTSLHIPASVKTIEESAFVGSNIASFSIEDGNEHYCVVDGLLYTADTSVLLAVPSGYAGAGGALALPPGVQRIAALAMDRVSSQLMSLTLPDGLRELGECALGSYNWSVELPSTLVRLEGCPVNKRPAVPFSLTVNEANPNYRMEDGQLMSIAGDTLFLVQLTAGENTYSVPEGTKVLASCVFYNWGRNLDSVFLPEGLEEIGESAFQESRVGVSLPSTLRKIGPRAFCGNAQMRDLTLPARVREIGAQAFCMTPLHAIVLSDSLEIIGREAFLGCTGLVYIAWGSRLKEIHPGAFRTSAALQLPPFPPSLRSIGAEAFLQNYDYASFEAAPDIIGELGLGARTVRLGMGNPPLLYKNALLATDTVYIPCGMAEVYRGAVLEGWGERFTYVEDCDGIGDPASGRGPAHGSARAHPAGHHCGARRCAGARRPRPHTLFGRHPRHGAAARRGRLPGAPPRRQSPQGGGHALGGR